MRWEITQNERNDETMVKTSKTMAAVMFALAAGAVYAVTDIYGNEIKSVDGGTYQFLVSGNPETAASEGCVTAESSAASVATGRLADYSVLVSALEARHLTRGESSATSLMSTERHGFIITIR